MSSSSKILVVRTDKLGDVLMCLPAVEYLRKSLPSASIGFHFSENFYPTLKPYLDVQKIHFLKAPTSWWQTLRSEKYDAVLILNGADKISRAAFFAGVKNRVGMFSRPTSFLFFNGGLRQKRSRAEKSEAEYNLELAERLVRKLTADSQAWGQFKIEIPCDDSAKVLALETLKRLNVNSESFMVLHPGMAGSALNPSLDSYLSIIRELKSTGSELILSVGPHPNDRAIASKLEKHFPDIKKLEGHDLLVLKELFRLAKIVIAPSTGPIHLAHYVGTPTIGLYSPVKSHHPKRWAPWGGNAAVKIIYPEVECPGLKDCVGAGCPIFYCMDKLPWGSLILQAANGLKT